MGWCLTSQHILSPTDRVEKLEKTVVRSLMHTETAVLLLNLVTYKLPGRESKQAGIKVGEAE